MFTLADDLCERLNQLRCMTVRDRQAMLRRLSQGCPNPPWPFGMPACAFPHVAFLGVSPGASPREADKGMVTDNMPGDQPTFGEAHGGFSYADPKHYWAKVSHLGAFLIRRDMPSWSDEKSLSLCSHLNLGTGQKGEADAGAIQRDLIPWVSGLFGSCWKAKVLVCFGLKKFVSTDWFDNLWNSRGGLAVDWRCPTASCSFDRYQMNLWRGRRIDGSEMAVIAWPNHPSRHPFAGQPNAQAWCEAERCVARLLRQNGF